jgi:hypothetical protein
MADNPEREHAHKRRTSATYLRARWGRTMAMHSGLSGSEATDGLQTSYSTWVASLGITTGRDDLSPRGRPAAARTLLG